jgi:hypothetical protein
VKPLAIGGAVGADGVITHEVHPTLTVALSDAEQQLTWTSRGLHGGPRAGPRTRRVPPQDPVGRDGRRRRTGKLSGTGVRPPDHARSAPRPARGELRLSRRQVGESSALCRPAPARATHGAGDGPMFARRGIVVVSTVERHARLRPSTTGSRRGRGRPHGPTGPDCGNPGRAYGSRRALAGLPLTRVGRMRRRDAVRVVYRTPAPHGRTPGRVTTPLSDRDRHSPLRRSTTRPGPEPR